MFRKKVVTILIFLTAAILLFLLLSNVFEKEDVIIHKKFSQVMTEKKALITEVDLPIKTKESILDEMYNVYNSRMQLKYYKIKDGNFQNLTKRIIIAVEDYPDYIPAFMAIRKDSAQEYHLVRKFSRHYPYNGNYFYWDGVDKILNDCRIKITQDNVLHYLDIFFLITTAESSPYAPKIIYESTDLDFLKRSDRFRDRLFNHILRKSFHKPTVEIIKDSKTESYFYKVSFFMLIPVRVDYVNLDQYDVIVDETGKIIKQSNNSYVTHSLKTQKNTYWLLYDRYNE